MCVFGFLSGVRTQLQARAVGLVQGRVLLTLCLRGEPDGGASVQFQAAQAPARQGGETLCEGEPELDGLPPVLLTVCLTDAA